MLIVGAATAAAIGGGWFAYLAQAAAPSTDADALIPIHPGAATYYNGNRRSRLAGAPASH
jgi:hypothetical protein